jgi:hypothetical protein
MGPEVAAAEPPRQAPIERAGPAGQKRAASSAGERLRHSLPAMPAVAAAVLARSDTDEELSSLDLYIPDSVAPEDVETASSPDSSGGTSDWSLDGLLQRAVDARLQRKAKDTKALCPKYDGYDKSIDVGTYNCAGLAWRTYTYRGDLKSESSAVAAGESKGKPGKVKLWFWEYDLHLETDDGRRGPEGHDFHMVGGVVDKAGKDPDDVYTKNGARPVFGPGTGPGFKPPARDRATSNDPSNTPQSTDDGAALYKVRSNFKQTVKHHPCPK